MAFVISRQPPNPEALFEGMMSYHRGARLDAREKALTTAKLAKIPTAESIAERFRDLSPILDKRRAA